jgi:hypothetical protein
MAGGDTLAGGTSPQSLKEYAGSHTSDVTSRSDTGKNANGEMGAESVQGALPLDQARLYLRA